MPLLLATVWSKSTRCLLYAISAASKFFCIIRWSMTAMVCPAVMLSPFCAPKYTRGPDDNGDKFAVLLAVIWPLTDNDWTKCIRLIGVASGGGAGLGRKTNKSSA